ncbi:hypothetical protein J437_LFUL000492 [Ladona fulva]|uniref:Uncharacterized protein n=1 Tax=Ladona fulva TaxID=123851 RepID=A0A8K0NU35_LADFU|nr:hypothetical protein J437_LFUL000492 [Ladona fulva]
MQSLEQQVAGDVRMILNLLQQQLVHTLKQQPPPIQPQLSTGSQSSDSAAGVSVETKESPPDSASNTTARLPRDRHLTRSSSTPQSSSGQPRPERSGTPHQTFRSSSTAGMEEAAGSSLYGPFSPHFPFHSPVPPSATSMPPSSHHIASTQPFFVRPFTFPSTTHPTHSLRRPPSHTHHQHQHRHCPSVPMSPELRDRPVPPARSMSQPADLTQCSTTSWGVVKGGVAPFGMVSVQPSKGAPTALMEQVEWGRQHSQEDPDPPAASVGRESKEAADGIGSMIRGQGSETGSWEFQAIAEAPIARLESLDELDRQAEQDGSSGDQSPLPSVPPGPSESKSSDV